MDGDWEDEFQQYCNYPEISKSQRLCLDVEERPVSGTSSSGLPSFSSAISDVLSQPNIFHAKEDSQSLHNYYRSLVLLEDSSGSVIEEGLESSSSNITTHDETDYQVKDDVFGKDVHGCDIQALLDPTGWMKYASHLHPWSEETSTCSEDDDLICSDGILSHEMVSACSRKVGQLPDTKQFVLTRLNISNKDLEDISVLSDYRYFQFMDLSWNFLRDLTALSNSTYLIFLNVSHNKLTEVLDLKPPWFLTHINLSCNEIKEIGSNISNFWSLCHVDLSSNFIEKIEGFNDLKYLRHLNLSHNQIRKVQKLNCPSLEEFHLQFNKISEWESEDIQAQHLKRIKELNLSHNKLSSLLPFKEFCTLEKLDVSNNCITELYEIDNLTGAAKFYELNMIGNAVCSYTGYRELVIYKLPALKTFDSIPVCCSERVAARMLLEPDVVTRTQHLRSMVEVWNQLAKQEVNKDTVPSDQTIPLLILVGTFANYKEELAKTLADTFPNQIYRFKKYTTMPLAKNHDPENLMSVSINEFNTMIRNGHFLVYYREIGFLFGICRDEVCKCVTDGEIGIIDTILEAAMVLKTSGLYPILVLSVLDDEEKYENTLRSHFMNMGLWDDHCPVEVHRSSEYVSSSHENSEKECCHKDLGDSVNTINRIRAEEYFSSNSSGCLDISEEENSLMENSASSCFNKHPSSDQSLVNKISSADESTRFEEDDFIWTWSTSTSENIEPQANEYELNMAKGMDKFIKNTLLQQNIYVEIHNSQPGLFKDAILTDNIEEAQKKVEQICHSMLKKDGENQNNIENLINDSLCTDFIQDRVKYLMNDLLAPLNHNFG